ncbi:glycoside hydrolase family 95 protein [Aporhodopirellula aestuarii]|uniref:Glycoside hydrolase family 95 protein n=1 Tax=Aporhodopirellula aestuarii TaxID=2950107 RepID=A0ABT0TYX1_9BACT|nr:glycoside hydrolase family 95 protein [Aporhodopirellula aestuarii]MCM2369793.1 glycoside hydrolase family 95 protein [Aporhodopirellula aestuarii]
MKKQMIAGLVLVLCAAVQTHAQNRGYFNYKEAAGVLPLNQPPSEPLSLWYNQPSKVWEDALPVGNGRMGAMVYGGVSKERITLNEDTIWAGPPVPVVKENVSDTIQEVRRLLFAGQYAEAQKLQQSVMSPRISPRSYQPLGELVLDFGDVAKASGYRRDLNLDTAVATTVYEVDGVTFTREVFASPVDDVVVVRLAADNPGALSFAMRVNREGIFSVTPSGNDTLIATGQASHGDKHLGVKFASRYKVVAENGSTTTQNSGVSVSGADSAVIYVTAATDYNRDDTANPFTHDLEAVCAKVEVAATEKAYSQLKADSIASHQKYFRRVSLDLGEPSSEDTLSRLEGYRNPRSTKIDPNFEALFFQYGRYLLITSSRPGTMPANLQGVWNKDMQAPWNSDYHININMQMNYWLAEVTNLSECHLPFMDYIERLVPSGQKTARDLYSCRGFLAGHGSDAWHSAVPFGMAQYGQWVVGGAWCTRHFMQHYRFTKDRKFLEERAYPILKESALFFLDWLVEDPKTGKLVSGPSTSPENKFFIPGTKEKSNLTMGPSMDQQIIWDVFSNTLEAAEILGIDDAFTQDVQQALDKLAMPKIGSDGRLMEWTEEFAEPEPGHRHISHLYGLYPGRQYNQTDTPEYMAAMRKSIDTRLASGGGHTGWSRAWIINFWARFKDADNAHENLVMLLKKSTYNNLFDKHAPFQIDGNFGGAAGMAEMLLQSHTGEIELLPVLPEAWADGAVTGLCARGGFEVDMQWKDGELVSGTLRSKTGLPCTVRYRDQVLKLATEKGGSYDLGALATAGDAVAPL